MKLSIATLLEATPWGGSEDLWALLVHTAIDHGHSVEGFLPYWPAGPDQVQAMAERGMKCIFSSHSSQRLPFATRLRNKLGGNPMWLAAQLRRARPECLVLNLPTALVFGEGDELAAYLTNRHQPFFLIIQHNFEEPVSDQCRQACRDVFKRARRVFFVADRNREAAERQLAYTFDNALLVHNPVKSGLESIRWPSSRTTARMACVARFDVRFKGHDVLLEALSADTWRTRDWQLSLYGEGGDRSYLVELVKHYKLSDRVRFMGQQADVRKIWEEEELLVLASRSEGTPLALLEALIAGRPAVVADAGDSARWVIPNATGFVAYSGSSRSMNEALDSAWGCRDRWAAMGSEAHRTTIARLDPNPGATLLNHILGSDST